MTKLLVKLFIKNSHDTDNVSVRTSYGTLAGAVGIVCNTLLFLVKLAVGLTLNSVSVMADAFNNLSDAGSSVISLIGVKMAAKPADKDHPFGHGRIEYIAALIVSFLVIEVGFTFFKDSLSKIFTPETMTFQTVSIFILLLSVCVKLWLGAFNRKLGKAINSKVMMAAAADSMGDVITTSVTILSILIFAVFHINVDGYVGLLVAGIVIWAGIGIAKDTLKPLIGEPADPKLYEEIICLVESHEGIIGTHDLIIHNYGPSRSMASIHAEVPNNVSIETSHEVIDHVEREAAKTLGIFLVIHMDPVEMQNDRIQTIQKQVEAVLAALDKRLSLHDFRLVDGQHEINLIFDLVVPHEYSSHHQQEILLKITSKIKCLDKRYQCVITIDKSFVSAN